MAIEEIIGLINVCKLEEEKLGLQIFCGFQVINYLCRNDDNTSQPVAGGF